MEQKKKKAEREGEPGVLAPKPYETTTATPANSLRTATAAETETELAPSKAVLPAGTLMDLDLAQSTSKPTHLALQICGAMLFEAGWTPFPAAGFVAVLGFALVAPRCRETRQLVTLFAVAAVVDPLCAADCACVRVVLVLVLGVFASGLDLRVSDGRRVGVLGHGHR